MVTGASTANAAIILIDARNGVIEQTLRHSYIASLLQIKHIIVCINKMDLVDYKKDVFNKIKKDYNDISGKLAVKDIRFVPISAKYGDNVVDESTKMDWYTGPTLMHLLETIDISQDVNLENRRFPVQYVIRPNSDEFHDYRGYAGRVAGGIFKPGDKVTILPSGNKSTIKSIDIYENSIQEAFPPQAVSLTLEDDIDISRGYMIVKENDQPNVGQEITMMLCWLNEKPMALGGKYAIKHTTSEARCLIKSVDFKVNINTLEHDMTDKSIKLNDIAQITIKTTKPLMFDSYKKNRITGSIIIINEATNVTVGAGMIV